MRQTQDACLHVKASDGQLCAGSDSGAAHGNEQAPSAEASGDGAQLPVSSPAGGLSLLDTAIVALKIDRICLLAPASLCWLQLAISP